MNRFVNSFVSKVLVGLALLLAATGCIHNDIPYPRIQANFRTFDVREQIGAPVIDSVNMVITVPLDENTDIYNVHVDGYTLSPGTTIVDNPFGQPISLGEPLLVYLHMYQDWLWQIKAKQDIERYFEVQGQMGESTIDVPAHRVVVYVRASADLRAIPVVRAKLGPSSATMTPDLSTEGATFDGTRPCTVEITNYGRTETWIIYTQLMRESVKTVSADAWTCVAWVTGRAEAGLDNGVEYRLIGTEEWTRVPAEDVTANGGTFVGCIKHLSPNSQYEARCYSETDYGDVLPFTSGAEVQLPNSDMEWWWKNKRTWNPWKEGGEEFWGTGNPGATIAGESNVFPTEDTPSGTGYAACLESRFVSVLGLGKFAAGSLFAGYYVRTDGVNGVLSMGRPFTERPTKITGMYKCTNAIIDKVDAKNAPFTASMLGQPDTCIVWCALVDCDNPIEIRTNPKDPSLFDPNADYVVAYGSFEQWQTVSSYVPFEIELKYRATNRVPKYILLTASSSKYGDYFTGGVGSTLWIDDYKLLYDY